MRIQHRKVGALAHGNPAQTQTGRIVTTSESAFQKGRCAHRAASFALRSSDCLKPIHVASLENQPEG